MLHKKRKKTKNKNRKTAVVKAQQKPPALKEDTVTAVATKRIKSIVDERKADGRRGAAVRQQPEQSAVSLATKLPPNKGRKKKKKKINNEYRAAQPASPKPASMLQSFLDSLRS